MRLPPEEWDEIGKWQTAVQTFLILAGFVVFVAVIGDGKSSSKPLRDLKIYAVEDVDVAPEKHVEIKLKETPPKPKVTEADIALKKKKKIEELDCDKVKREDLDEEEKAECDRRKADEKVKKEKERKKKEKDDKQKKIDDEKKRKEQKRLDNLAAKERADKAARASELAGLQDRYVGRIIGRIESHLITPIAAKNIEGLGVVVKVRLYDDGRVLDCEVVEPSGSSEYDDAACRAVQRAAPLPMPRERELLEEFRILRLHITP